MSNEQRLIEVMPELLAEVQKVRLEIKGMRKDFNIRSRQDHFEWSDDSSTSTTPSQY